MLRAALAQHPLPVGSRGLGTQQQAALRQPLRKVIIQSSPLPGAPAAPAAPAASASNFCQKQLDGPAGHRTAQPLPAAARPTAAYKPAPTAAWPAPPPRIAAAAAAPPVPAPPAVAVHRSTAPPAVDEASLGRQLAEAHQIPLSYLRSLLVLA